LDQKADGEKKKNHPVYASFDRGKEGREGQAISSSSELKEEEDLRRAPLRKLGRKRRNFSGKKKKGKKLLKTVPRFVQLRKGKRS